MCSVHVSGEPLFWGGELREYLSDCSRHIKRHIEGQSRERLASLSDEGLLHEVLENLAPRPIVLLEDEASLDDPQTGTEERQSYGRHITVYVQIVRVTIPWTGTPTLWRCKPSSWQSVLAYGGIEPFNGHGNLVLEIKTLASTDADQFKKQYDEALENIRWYVEAVNADLRSYLEDLSGFIAETISAHRGRVLHGQKLAEALGIPLKKNTSAPQPQLVPLRPALKRKPTAPRPVPRGSAKAEAEYAIKSEDYEHIIKVLRHVGRTFERLPQTFFKFDEEELRDILLAHLNGHYYGIATAEAFRVRGKTDICLEFDNRAAFVGECKIWSGAKALTDAVEQMLGYVTWRDVKTALIIFNKNVDDFTTVIKNAEAALKGHGLFVRDLDIGEHAEWRVDLKPSAVNFQNVTCHVIMIDISKGKPKSRKA